MKVVSRSADAASLARACRQAGLKATPQRLAVFQALLAAHDHPTPEAVFRRVRGAMPSISLATVYKTLDSLEQKGLLSRVSLARESKRYDANLRPHHHLICTRCGSIADHEDARLAPRLPRSLGGFSAREVRLQILGLCRSCRGVAEPGRRGGRSAPRR
jgi:Fur family peroxide stress response transcriptional regulator